MITDNTVVSEGHKDGCNMTEKEDYMVELSVIMISFNEAKYLKNAIDSCLNQSFQNFEIIIGDDGSSDGSLQIIQDYVKKYPRKIQNFIMERTELGGVIASIRVSNVIKTGLSKANGKYILVLSGDDYFNDRFCFEEQITLLHREKCSACVAGYRKFWDSGKEIICRADRLPPFLYWSGSYMHLSCFMFKKEVFQKGLLLERFCDDTGMEYSIALLGKWVYLDKITFSYRQRNESIMHKADEMELALVELLLLQDICLKKRYQFSSWSRFSRPLNYVYDHKKELEDKKYQKYFTEADKNNYNMIGKMREYSKLPIVEKTVLYVQIRSTRMFAFIFKILRKAVLFM